MQEPINALTGQPYHGKNVDTLLAVESDTMIFATMAQWNELGRAIIKGEKHCAVVRLGFRKDEGGSDEQESSGDGSSAAKSKKGKGKGFHKRGSMVFCYEQTEEAEWAKDAAAKRKARRESKGSKS